MKRLLLFAAVIIALPLFGAETPKECGLCVGAVSPLPVSGQEVIPILVRISNDDFATAGPQLDALSIEQRKKMTVVVSLTVEGADPLTGAETKARSLVEWARLHGPFDSLGLAIRHDDPAIIAYTIKRIAVTAQGLNVAERIAVADPDLQALFDSGAHPYFDAVIVGEADVERVAAILAEKDPSKKIYATGTPQSPNPMYDLASALSKGATRAYLAGPAEHRALANLNRALAGDYAFDSAARTTILDAKGNATDMPALSFVRGEDLRTLVIPRGVTAGASIVALPGDQFERPYRVDAAGERAITDTGKRGGRLLVGFQPSSQPYLLALSRSQKLDKNITREAIEISTRRGISVEEIIRNHQAYDAYQETIQPRYIARNTTKLRFDIGAGSDAVEATISGDYFSDPNGRADWVWQDFHINGVRWKYGRIPELPLIQPEKVTQLPLDIHLTNEYRYELVRETDLLGFHVYEVRFEPPPNAPEGLPLYRGTVWIDTRTWARVQLSMVQLNLTGEVLSNEERVDFQPFGRDTNAPLTATEVAALDARSIVWLPREVAAQQVISAAGRANAVQRSTTFSHFRINPPDFETRLAEISATDARMVRETAAGLRYLEKRGDGERVVKEGFDTSQMFMLGGVHHDAGLEFPVVPLGGIDYFNFNLGGRGIQANVFFAGVVIAANATHPNVGNTRTNVGADFFGIAIPVGNTIFRDGEEQKSEAVKHVPIALTLRAGHPVFNFGKIDLSFSAAHLTYQRGDETAADFGIPSDTFLLGPSISAQYARRGYSFGAHYDYTTRTSWEPWGNLAEYDDEQKTFIRYGASLGKSFYLPKFQRIGIDLNYLDGQRLDRFSKYELGFFGSQRIHGIKSGSVRAERAILGHLSYGFVLSEQFRLEAFYDYGLIDDAVAGYEREPFQGVGVAGQTVGPYGTLLRLDIGKTIGRNAQDGFVANVVFLKLF
jgi:hypothetical protein